MLTGLLLGVIIFGGLALYDKFFGGTERRIAKRDVRDRQMYRDAVEKVYGKDEADRLLGKRE